MKRWLILLAAFPLLASAAAERIVSLGGDVTEVVYALDAQRQLVAKDSTNVGRRERIPSAFNWRI